MATDKKYTKRRYNKKSNSIYRFDINKENIYRVKQTIKEWRYALESAEDIHFPLRTDLQRSFYDSLLDPHLSNLVQLLKDKITNTEFQICNESTDETNDDAQYTFEQSWFYNFLETFVDTIFWGHSLIQIDGIIDNEIDSIQTIKREYVSPEKHLIKDSIYQLDGIDYTSEKHYKWLIEIGDRFDLGLLAKLVPYTIYKKLAITYWSDYTESFGVPYKIAKTKSTSVKDREQMFNMMQNMVGKGGTVMSENDSLELLESKNTDVFNVYNKLLDYCNNEMSKLIFGSVDAIEGGSGGSEARATVHNSQNIDRIKSILKKIQFYVNDNLIPQLKMLGVIKTDVYLKWNNKEKLTLNERSEVDSKIAANMIGKFTSEYLEQTYNVDIIEQLETDETENEVENE